MEENEGTCPSEVGGLGRKDFDPALVGHVVYGAEIRYGWSRAGLGLELDHRYRWVSRQAASASTRSMTLLKTSYGWAPVNSRLPMRKAGIPRMPKLTASPCWARTCSR